MGIKQSFSSNKLDLFLQTIPQIVSEEIIRSLSYLGEQSIKRIRDRSGDESWYDQTGNLRSSIGYAVIEDGKKIIESAFKTVKNGLQGAEAGRKLIDELASQYSKTYALVVVAGMEYAEYVEAMKNKDVLASAEIWAKQQINRYLEKSLERAYGRIFKLQTQLGL